MRSYIPSSSPVGNSWHRPVMVAEVLDLLRPHSPRVYCDLTVGEGGHAEQILEASSPAGRLLGIDRDAGAIEVARARLAVRFASERFELVHDRFSRLEQVARERGFGAFDGILADFGLSSRQLEDPSRGFSFSLNGPLDMRMDPSEPRWTALDLVRNASVKELARILREYSGEKKAPKIARAIKELVAAEPALTTGRLASAVRNAAGRRRTGRIDAATRTFQALRIAVNEELEEITKLLGSLFSHLAPGGVAVCISYHSLEDRIVKRAMVEAERAAKVEVLTPKPLRPSSLEVASNRRARSARLRAARRLEAVCISHAGKRGQ